jgi:hypothetical protein
MVSRREIPYRQTSTAMRWMLVVASLLVFLAGAPLLLVADQTAEYFAWTISPQITAAFLGASYWSSGIFEFLASRERIWGRARLAVPAVLVFTILTLIVTLVHINRFHFDFPFTDADARTTDPLTVFGTWMWLAIYAGVPLAMGIILVRQARMPGDDPPAVARLGWWVRAIIITQASLLILVGTALLLVPTSVAPLWPWKLTALTARAIGAWLIGLSLTGVQALYENDRTRLGPAGVVAFTWAIAQLAIVAVFAGSIDWTRPTSGLYIAFVVTVVAIGAAAIYANVRSRRGETTYAAGPSAGEPPSG